MALDALQERLGYRFDGAALLRQALTHRSHGATHNERLEFLGDSVLNCAVASLLYERFGKLDEGDLSRVRANLVKQQTLFEIAQRLDLSGCLLLGEGEQKSGGFRRPSILADTLEAVFGAIFLDGGFDAAQQAIRRLYEPVLRNVDPNTLGKDAKTLLQEWLQSRKIPLPVYSVVATHGAAHNQLFEVECSVPKLSIQVLGSGGSRRAAEQGAAKLALEQAQAMMPASVRKPRRGARAAAAEAAAEAAAAAESQRTGAAEMAAQGAATEPATSHAPVATVAPLPGRGRGGAVQRGEQAAAGNGSGAAGASPGSTASTASTASAEAGGEAGSASRAGEPPAQSPPAEPRRRAHAA